MSIEQSQIRHHQAMECYDKAMHAKRQEDQSRDLEWLRQAYMLEKEAAQLIAGEFDLEPSRSVLYRSAASLAIQCGETREAERLLAAGLAGFPQEEIADELRDLLEQIYAKRSRKGETALA